METKCIYENRKWKSGNRFTCVFSNASTEEDNRRIKLDLRSLDGRNTGDVQGIILTNSPFPLLPLNLTETFFNLTVLSIINCGLSEMTRSDLIGLEGLVDLDVHKNMLTSLPNDLLTDMKNLKWIDLSENRIKGLDSRMFEGIKSQINFLDLRYNISINDFFNRADGKPFDDFMSIIDTKCFIPTIKTAEATTSSSSVYGVKNYSENFLKGFETLWLTQRFSDLTIVVEKVEFKVNKAVLATQSKVFASMFENDQEDRKTNRLTILNFSSAAFEDFLRFLYTGRIQRGMNAVEIFSIASMYDVPDLKALAEKEMMNNVDVSNAMAILKLANVHESTVLMRRSFDLIKRAYPGIMFQDSLMRKPDVIKKLIEAKEEYDRAIEDARRNLEEVMMNAA